jgi:hypothetical protein
VLPTFDLVQVTADEPPGGNCGAPPGGEGNYTYGNGFVNVLAAVEACVGGTMHEAGMRIRAREFGDGNYRLSGLVRIRDQDRAPVAGAMVEVKWTLPSGAGRSRQGLTSTSGIAGYRLRSRQTGTYEMCVVDVAKAGFVYDPGQNWATCQTIQVP